jgi:hypothetical protein
LDIQFLNITDCLYVYKDRLEIFLDKMDSEKRFFNLTLERALRSEFVLIVLLNNDIIGIGGVEVKYGIPRSFIMLDKSTQGKGIGRTFAWEIQHEASKHHNFLLGIIEENNNAPVKLSLIYGYKIVGKRGKLIYLICPLNSQGLLLYLAFRFLFYFIKPIDLIRR